jgi:hypothetical protein
MELLIQRRAQIALRSLQKSDQDGIKRALVKLSEIDRIELSRNHNFKLLATHFSSRKIAVYRATHRLRLILSFEGDSCIIEDIVDRERVERVVNREGQK